MRVLLALGGNAMTNAEGRARPEDQIGAADVAMDAVAELLERDVEVVITHGNGPQVGNLLVKNELAAAVVPPVPLDWCGAQSGERIRRRSGLHFERVLHVQRFRFDQRAPTKAILFSIAFERDDHPAGIVTLHFDDGGAIRLKVECLEAAMSDLGPAWPCGSPPPARA